MLDERELRKIYDDATLAWHHRVNQAREEKRQIDQKISLLKMEKSQIDHEVFERRNAMHQARFNIDGVKDGGPLVQRIRTQPAIKREKPLTPDEEFLKG